MFFDCFNPLRGFQAIKDHQFLRTIIFLYFPVFFFYTKISGLIIYLLCILFLKSAKVHQPLVNIYLAGKKLKEIKKKNYLFIFIFIDSLPFALQENMAYKAVMLIDVFIAEINN